MINLRMLTEENKSYFFKKGKFTKNQLCKYDPDYFLFTCVKKLAQENNIEVKYIDKNYPELRKRLGAFSFFIKDGPESIMQKGQPSEQMIFQTKELFWR